MEDFLKNCVGRLSNNSRRGGGGGGGGGHELFWRVIQ